MSKPPFDKITKQSQNFDDTDNTAKDKSFVTSDEIPKVQKLEVESLNYLILFLLVLSLEGLGAAEEERTKWKAYAKCYIAKHKTTCDAALRHVRREIYREIKKVLFNWLIGIGVFATVVAAVLAVLMYIQ